MSGAMPEGREDRPEADDAEERGPERRRRRRVLRRVLAAVAILLVLFLLTPTGRYLARAAWEEGKILARRRPIAEIVKDAHTDWRIRAKLEVVLAARRYARDSLGLAVRQSFTTYSQLDSDTLVLVVSAAYRDELRRFTWWFPIVGRVPYKGFFDFDAARAAARQLERRGFDVYLRPSPAFSTLGFFNDPLLSTTLRDDSIGLANTVIHETTHNTFYAPGQAVFNESFANFVGGQGAIRFFRARGDTTAALDAQLEWMDERLLGTFWEGLYRSIDSAFAAHPRDRRARLAARDSIYRQARRTLVARIGPQLRTISPLYAERVRLDNAALLSQRIYLTGLDLFDAVLGRERGDLRAAIRRIIAIARSRPKDPYGAMKDWLRGAARSAERPLALPFGTRGRAELASRPLPRVRTRDVSVSDVRR